MTDLQYWVGFSRIPGVGPARLALLQRRFPTLEEAWQAEEGALLEAGLDRRTVTSIVTRRSKIVLEEEMERLDRYGVQVLIWDHPSYPPRLKEIYDLPPVLFMRGSLEPQDQWAIAVVGTRRVTPYGREVTRRLVSDLARSGITIVSGLARGVDTEAHRAALEAGGRTIAVQACGLDMVYPPENAPLAREIIQQGALLSEHPLGTRPEGQHFPRRNRIMSGLALGVLVTEAGESSGAHSTVRHALEQDREVFAVPGSILSPLSRGTNRWIQEGAKLVMEAQDILQELNLSMVVQQMEVRNALPTDRTEALLLNHLSPEPTHIDVVCRECGLPVSTVSSTLAMMELKGLVRQVGGMNYVAV